MNTPTHSAGNGSSIKQLVQNTKSSKGGDSSSESRTSGKNLHPSAPSGTNRVNYTVVESNTVVDYVKRERQKLISEANEQILKEEAEREQYTPKRMFAMGKPKKKKFNCFEKEF